MGMKPMWDAPMRPLKRSLPLLGLVATLAVPSLAQSETNGSALVEAGAADLRDAKQPQENPIIANIEMVPASFLVTVRLRAKGMARHEAFDKLGFGPEDANVLRAVAQLDNRRVKTAAAHAARHLVDEMCSLPEAEVIRRGMLLAEYDRAVSDAMPAAIAKRLAELTPEGAATLRELIGGERASKAASVVDLAALAFEDPETMASLTANVCEGGLKWAQ